jgi:hypothetical protein
MAKLVVLKGGKPFAELELMEGNEYFIGRDKSCDVVLGADKGISRKHMVIKFDGQWRVEMLSKMNNLVVDETLAGEAELSNDMSFEVYPYYFILKEEPIEEQPAEEPESEPAEPENALVTSEQADQFASGDNTHDGTHGANNNLPAVQGHQHQGQTIGSEDETINAANLPALIGHHAGAKKARVLNMMITGVETGRDELIQLDDAGPSWMQAARKLAKSISMTAM